MRLVLNGLLGGLPFRGRLLMSIPVWTSTSTSLAMRRQRSPSPQTILENRMLPLRLTPLLHPLLLPLMPDFPRISSLSYRRFFFFAGLGTHNICSRFLNE